VVDGSGISPALRITLVPLASTLRRRRVSAMEENGRKPGAVWPVVVFSATLLVLAALIVKLFLAPEVSTALVIAIAALAGLLVLSPRVFDFAELSLSKEGLVAKIRDVERKVESTEEEVKKAERKIDQLFAYTMSDSIFGNLRKLATGQFGHFKNNGGLRRELRHLRDIGYIAVRGHIGDLPEEGNNLSDYVTITPVGKDFVALRESMEAESNE
jgi:hypothetical protein